MDSSPRSRSSRPFALALLFALSGSACGDGGVEPFVPVPTDIGLSTSSLALTSIGETRTVVATVIDQNGDPISGQAMTWVSDDESIAVVSETGNVAAIGNGRTTLRVRSGSVEATLDVAVAQAVATLRILGDSATLTDPGDTLSLALDVRDEGGTPVSDPVVEWSSTAPSVVTVSQGGVIEGVEEGEALVIGQAGGVADTVVVVVDPPLTLAIVGTLPLSASVASELSISARVLDLLGQPFEGRSVSWTVAAGSGEITSAPSVSSDAAGVVGAVWRLGTAAGTQRALANLQSRGEVVTVEFVAEASPGPAATAVLVADSILLSARGETAFLGPTVLDPFENPTVGFVDWFSADPGVAEVAVDGLITGVGEGATWISAAIDGAVTDSILVTVVMRGAITITFDDGFRGVYENAWPLLREFGIQANVAVNPTPVDESWPDYMTLEMLDELHGAGWSMVSHTLRHDSLSTLSPSELDFDLRTSQKWLRDRDYNGWNVFVAPYHDYGPAQRDAVSQYYAASRGRSSDAVSPDSLVGWRPDNPYLLTGREAELLPYTTAQGRGVLRDLLQRTADEGAFLDIFFHRVPSENVDALRALLEVVSEFRERVLTYHELYPIFARTVH